MIGLMDKNEVIGRHIRGMSNRAIARETGLSRGTVNKYVREFDELQARLTSADPEDVEEVREVTAAITAEPKYDASNRKPTKWTPEADARLDEILAEEARKSKVLGPNKQALTKGQIHRMLRADGFDIGLTTACRYINMKLEARAKEAFIKQEYEFGQRFEYDFGEVKLVIAGTMRKLQMAVMAMPASGGRFGLLYESQKMEVFIDSQVRFFEWCGGCFREGVYDNMRNVVKRFIGRTEKELNPELVKLAAYYGFALNVTNCYAGNEKGAVEEAVKVLRREAFAEKWEFGSVQEAQAWLDKKVAELNEGLPVEDEKRALTPWRPPYELADERPESHVDKYSCVTYDNCHYSVPDTLVGKKVLVKAYPKEVRVVYRDREVARHERSYENGGMILDIHHYVGTFRRKPGALANSAVLKGNRRLKGVFDAHYSCNPREFVEIVAANPGVGADALADILLMRATSGGMEKASATDDRIAEQAAAQVARVCAIGKGVRRAS